MEPVMAKFISFLSVWFIAGSILSFPVHAQEILEQLENRLREATGQATEASPPEKGETEPSESTAEELPLPGNRPENAPAAKPPQVKPRPTPKVIIPRSQRRSSPPANPTPPPEGDSEGEGYLGLTLEPIPGGNFGLSVVEVTPQSPAWKSGFRLGDRVVGVGGQAVTTIDQFAAALKAYAPGQPIKFLVQRQGRSIPLTSVLQGRDIAQQIQGNLQGQPQRRTPYQPISNATADGGGLMLGVSVSNLSEAFRQQFSIPVFRGASVSEVVVGSPAEVAGIRPGDCIVEIDGQMVLFADDVVRISRSATPGQTMQIGFYRGVQMMRADVFFPGDLGEGVQIGDAMMNPGYVAGLQAEIARLQEELEAMRLRVQELESRLQPNRR